ncbi:hypothetical protein GCM10007385_12830 [Tateyamaria omphalii]|nr:hypothetical protein GCM10007385_12830 [Tateyamaria omphalii]
MLQASGNKVCERLDFVETIVERWILGNVPCVVIPVEHQIAVTTVMFQEMRQTYENVAAAVRASPFALDLQRI